MAIFLTPLLTLKRWAEKWQHRLQGHLLVTWVKPDGTTHSYWAADIYSNGGVLWADLVSNSTGAAAILIHPQSRDYTITGA